MNQLAIAGIGAALIAAGGFGAGWRVNSWRHDSQELAVQEGIEKGAKAAADAAVSAINGLQVKYVPIKQAAEVVIREVPIYSECRHDGRMLSTINQALSGGQPPDPASVPPAKPAR